MSALLALSWDKSCVALVSLISVLVYVKKHVYSIVARGKTCHCYGVEACCVFEEGEVGE